jgi:toxin ParE1/3/4
MSRVELAPELVDDFERILTHLAQHAGDATVERIDSIIKALDVLEHSPLIGRPAHEDLRELVIGRDTRGYVALYRYMESIDLVLVLAIRSQREAGYSSR